MISIITQICNCGGKLATDTIKRMGSAVLQKNCQNRCGSGFGLGPPLEHRLSQRFFHLRRISPCSALGRGDVTGSLTSSVWGGVFTPQTLANITSQRGPAQPCLDVREEVRDGWGGLADHTAGGSRLWTGNSPCGPHNLSPHFFCSASCRCVCRTTHGVLCAVPCPRPHKSPQRPWDLRQGLGLGPCCP